MALTRRQLAQRLREIREATGFTQAQVADVLGVHRPTISEIEAGRRAVTSEELYQFARIYAVPVSRLLAEPAPGVEEAERILYRSQGMETPAIRQAVRRFAERCRAEKELEEMLEMEPRPDGRPGFSAPAMRNKLDAIRQGEQLAEWERKRLDLGTEPLRNPLDLLERQGVRVGPLTGVEAEEIDGIYLETDELGACVGVNLDRGRESCFRVMFTTTHEYAHWLLQDKRVEGYTFEPAGDDLQETRANVFAAAFLMPEEGLREYFASEGTLVEDRIAGVRPDDIVRAMDYFGVSREALLYRLQNTRLMTEEEAAPLFDFPVMRTARAAGVEFRADFNVGTRFRGLVTKAWRRGMISAGRAADLLGTDLETFKERMEVLGPPEATTEEPLLGAAG